MDGLYVAEGCMGCFYPEESCRFFLILLLFGMTLVAHAILHLFHGSTGFSLLHKVYKRVTFFLISTMLPKE